MLQSKLKESITAYLCKRTSLDQVGGTEVVGCFFELLQCIHTVCWHFQCIHPSSLRCMPCQNGGQIRV